MPGPFVTASSIHRWLACHALPTLPTEDRPAGEAAEIGTEVHAWMDGEKSKNDLSVQAQAVCDSFNKVRWQSTYETREHAYGYSPLTGEFFKFGRLPGPRQYPDIAQPYIAGTADGVTAVMGTLVVADIKTGREYSYHWDQIRALVFMASDAEGGVGKLVYRKKTEKRVFSAEDMLDFRNQVDTAFRNMLFAQKLVDIGRDPVTTRGPHCKWCDSKRFCAEWGGTIKGENK